MKQGDSSQLKQNTQNNPGKTVVKPSHKSVTEKNACLYIMLYVNITLTNFAILQHTQGEYSTSGYCTSKVVG